MNVVSVLVIVTGKIGLSPTIIPSTGIVYIYLWSKMLRIRNADRTRRRVYIHTIREGKVATLGNVVLGPGETVSLSKKPRRVLLSTEEDYMRGIVPVYGDSATVVDTLHTITLTNEGSSSMKVKLFTVRGKFMSMKVCKGVSTEISVRSNDAVDVISKDRAIHASPSRTPMRRGLLTADRGLSSEEIVTAFLLDVLNRLPNLLGDASFTICSGCPVSTLSKLNLGNLASASDSMCIVPSPFGCVQRVGFFASIASVRGLDTIRITNFRTGPIIPSGRGRRMNFEVDFEIPDAGVGVTLSVNFPNIVSVSIMDDRNIALPGTQVVKIAGYIFGEDLGSEAAFLARNIVFSVVSLSLNMRSTNVVILEAINRVLPFSLLSPIIRNIVTVIPNLVTTLIDPALIRLVNMGLKAAESPIRSALNGALGNIPPALVVRIPIS